MAIVGSQRIVIEGAEATVRLGYQRAAVLGAWRVEGDWFTAKVQDVDAFRITQSPLTLEIPNPDGIPTRRAITDVAIHPAAWPETGARLSARLILRR